MIETKVGTANRDDAAEVDACSTIVEVTNQRHDTNAGSSVTLKERLSGYRCAGPGIVTAGPDYGVATASTVACTSVWASAGVITLPTGYSRDFLSIQNVKDIVCLSPL